MILHLDCDRGTGHHSVLDLIQAGSVVSYPCTSFEAADGTFWALYRKQIPMPDLIVVDTITKLAESSRQDATIKPSDMIAAASIGDNVVTNQRTWGISGDKINRLLRNIIELLPCPSIFIAHEGSREDTMTGGTGVMADLQKAILKNVHADADAIVRLTTTKLPLQYPDGTIIPAGARQLILKAGAVAGNAAIGVRTAYPALLPEYLINPTLDSYAACFGGYQNFPKNTLVYGPPKVGKTSFSCGADRSKG